METALPFHVYDVFTDRPYAGNPLAVVEAADGLSAAQMQAMAREFNLSETIFLMRPEVPAHAARVRIFTPTSELPFAGHPTLGCALHLAARAGAAEIVLEEPAGRVAVQVTREEGGHFGRFAAPVLPARRPGAAPGQSLAERAAEALGLETADLALPGQAPAVWVGGPAFLLVPVARLDALERAAPREPAWSRVTGAEGVSSGFLYTPDPEVAEAFRARMFSPAAGIPEDPATGSATALLAGQLSAAGALPEGTTRLLVRQGVEMGRPSRLTLEADVAGGRLAEVRVGGSAVKVAEGRIAAPPG